VAKPAPTRTAKHDALEVFAGTWKAEGTAYGDPEATGDPKAHQAPWVSTHDADWHTGAYFMVQDERAKVGGETFDTLSVMGVDAETGDYFARTFENHGFYRDYAVSRDGDVWTIRGDTERARIEFIDGGRTQVIAWEWRPEKEWVALCDRTARRTD
jgi:hypothetical protein